MHVYQLVHGQLQLASHLTIAMLEGDHNFHSDIGYIIHQCRNLMQQHHCPISDEAIIKPNIQLQLYKMQFDLNLNVHAMSAKFPPSFLIQIYHALQVGKNIPLIYCVLCAIISMHHDILHQLLLKIIQLQPACMHDRNNCYWLLIFERIYLIFSSHS